MAAAILALHRTLIAALLLASLAACGGGGDGDTDKQIGDDIRGVHPVPCNTDPTKCT